jgi:hypothetical protein
MNANANANANANNHGTSLPHHTTRPRLTKTALDALQEQFEALGHGESSNMAQPGSSQQKSRAQLEHELYSIKFVTTWNQGRDVAKLHTKYITSDERHVRKLMDQYAAAYRRLAFPATADLDTQVFTTQAMEQAQKDLAADLQALGYFEDASSEGAPEYNADELEMLGRNISDWAVSDLEYARDSKLLDKLSALQKVEFKLRAQQLAKTPSQLSQESQERRTIRYNVRRRKSNQGNTIARGAKLSNKPEHPAVTQLRHVDGLLYKLCKPRKIRKAAEHQESRDPSRYWDP